MPLNPQHECGVAVVDEMLVFPCKSGERRRRAHAPRAPGTGKPSSISVIVSEISYLMLMNSFACLSTHNSNMELLW
jgi:hypothetical protein